MSRLCRLHRLLVLALTLAVVPAAWAQDAETLQDSASGTGAGATESSPLEGVSASEPGYQALAAGLKAKEAGDLEKAEVYLREALDSAGTDGDVYWVALEELSFRLPLARAEDMIANEEWKELEALLETLVEENRSDDQKSLYLFKLIAQLREHVPAPGIPLSGENSRETLDHVEEALQRFLAENGHYPQNYEELNEILPADQFPLLDYDIVNYVSQGRAYGLTLRSKADPDNVLVVEKTGLLE
jgi:hypothetical protein